MATEKRGGPKSLAGKAKASKNSATHGLTASTPHGALEISSVKNYVDELVGYYKPQSPLEMLQIERIALCRSKLTRLYEVEQASLELVTNDVAENSMRILERMHGFSGWSKGIAAQLIEGREDVFPLGLTTKTLKAINDELAQSTVEVKTENALIREFPCLIRFLKMLWKTHGNAEFSADRCLSWAAKNIVPIEYRAKKDVNEPLPPYEAMLMGVLIDTQAQDIPATSTRPKDSSLGFHLSVREDLMRFQSLWKAFEAATELVEKYQATRVLMLKSVTIPADESDRLMRYQTALERRLSSAIGELLAIQNRRYNV